MIMVRKLTSTLNDTTASLAEYGPRSFDTQPIPGLLLIYHPPFDVFDDRAPIRQKLVIGRSTSCGLCVRDRLISRTHFSVSPQPDGSFHVTDLKSRHGIFLNGNRIADQGIAQPGDIIRAGECLFVIVPNMSELSDPDIDAHELPLSGSFYSGALVQRLKIISKTDYHLLISGESGVGKELGAKIFAELHKKAGRRGPFIAHNAAMFAGEDDAIATLFGVSSGAFTGVEPRKGAIELSDDGVLFVDEVHSLPLRVQRSLLRFVEDGKIQKLGKSVDSQIKTDVRLICGTNLDVEQACESGELASDLVARFYRLDIAPLRRRKADIPSIFAGILESSERSDAAQKLLGDLGAELVEALCLYEYRHGNVRELQQVAAITLVLIEEGQPPQKALKSAMEEIFQKPKRPESPGIPYEPSLASGPYDKHRKEISEAFTEFGGNLSKMVRHLESIGFSCTRQGLAQALNRWGIRPIPKRK